MRKASKAAVAASLAAALALGCSPAAAWAKDFSDVDYQGGWYRSAVKYVSDKGYMTGYDNSTEFGVGKTLTRAEFACLLYKRAGEPASSKTENTTGMPDIDEPTWYTAAANWAAKTKAITGVDTTTGKEFRPGEPVTREMMATILWRLSGGPSSSSAALDKIAGHDAVDSWALPAVRWAAEAGVLTGVDTAAGKDLQAVRPVLREEAAAMVERYDGLSSGGSESGGGATEPSNPGGSQGGATDPGTSGGSTGGSTEPSNPGGGSTGGTTEPSNPEPTPTDPAKQDQSAPVLKSFVASPDMPSALKFIMGDSDEYEYSINGGEWKAANGGEATNTFACIGLTPDTKYAISIRRAGDATHNPSSTVSKEIWTAVEKYSEAWKNIASGAYTLEWHGTAYYNGRDYMQEPGTWSLLDKNGNKASTPYIKPDFIPPASGGAGTGKLVVRGTENPTAPNTSGYGELSVDVKYVDALAFYPHYYFCQKCYDELKNRDQAVIKDADGKMLATYNVFDPAQFSVDTWKASSMSYELNKTWSARNTLANSHVDGKIFDNVKLVTYDKVSCPEHGQQDIRLYNEGDSETNGPGNNSWAHIGLLYVLADGSISSTPN